jgi:hypothetical protein
MSAPCFFHAQACGEVPLLLSGNPDQVAEDEASCLLLQTCAEQEGRCHALVLLATYLARPLAGRKRRVLEEELKNLRELVHAVWCEWSCAFPDRIVQACGRRLNARLRPQCPATSRNTSEKQRLLF